MDSLSRSLTLLALTVLLPAAALAQPGRGTPVEGDRGVRRHEEGAFTGYTLVTPLRSKKAHLVDMQGEVVHTWESEYSPGNSVYLQDDGTLLRAAREPRGEIFEGGGIGGRIQRLAWDGTVLWDFSYATSQVWQHHDFAPLPNGNVLLIAWERKTRDEILSKGRDPAMVQDGGLWPDHVVEIKPVGKTSGEIVWSWHVWDHLIQDLDPEKEGYGDPKDHPELLDVNWDRVAANEIGDADRARLEALGYLAPPDPADVRPPGPRGLDWMHTNSIDYSADLDQILLSIRRTDEIWIIDHSTTTKEAASHAGGRSGKGGDLLYRWGNPRIYRRGTEADQTLFGQHDARWIPKDFPGAGNLLAFNNGNTRPQKQYSAVDEIAPPLGPGGQYVVPAGRAFGPAQVTWSHTAPRKERFYSSFISGAERLSNGNTLVCNGEHGLVFEVTPEGETVWEWLSPLGGDVTEEERPPPSVQGVDAPGNRRGDGPRGPRGGGGAGGPGGGGGPPPTALFRASRIAPDHPGLVGKGLPSAGGSARGR